MLDFQNLIINHPELLEDSKKLRGYMMDIAPDKSDRPQINLLLLLMNDGILESFRRDDGWPALIDSITADVADRWSLDPIKAKKAVEMWYTAYKALQGATTKEANKQNAADSGNTYFSKLVGVTFQNANGESRQQIIRSLSKSGLLDAGAILQVVREPNNVYDPNAVAIYTPDGQQLGYLNRKDAAYVTQALDAGDKCQVISNGITGGINGNVYGVNITIKVEESAAIKNSASKEVTRDELKQVEQKQSTTPTNPPSGAMKKVLASGLRTEGVQNEDRSKPMQKAAIPSQSTRRRIMCHQCLSFISADSSICPYCNTVLSSGQPQCSNAAPKKNSGSWFDSYLNSTLKVDPNPPKYRSLQESDIPEESAQMKKHNYQKEAQKVKKVDASYNWDDDWDDDNDCGPDSIDDCYAEYHAYD